MPRGAQVIYPKDLGPILVLADITPGDRVFESGVGSGALSTVLLRAGAVVTGYEIERTLQPPPSQTFLCSWARNILDSYEIKLRDAYEEHDDSGFDRAVLDLPEPWRVVPHLENPCERAGSWSPTTHQLFKFKPSRKRLSPRPVGARGDG